MINPNLIPIVLAFILIISFWTFVFIIFYHLVRFGIGTQPKILSAVFIFGSFALFFMTVLFFSNIEWGILGDQILILIKNSNFISTSI
jgi:hypothetical protein